jgi:Glycosyltransferase family 87
VSSYHGTSTYATAYSTGAGPPRRLMNGLALAAGEPWFLALLGFLLFVGLLVPARHDRGPLRRLFSATSMSDFLPMYVQTKAWMKGTDPYSQASQVAFWPQQVFHAPLSPEYLLQRAGMPAPYPILVFVVLVPFAVLAWAVANASLVLLDFALLFVVIRALMRFSGMQGWRRHAWLAAVLAFEPIYAGMVINNIAVLAVECALLAVAMSETSPRLAAPVLLALSVALKPQIGFCVLVYFLLRRFWNLVTGTVALLGIFSTVALLRMQWAHLGWMESYIRASKFFFHAGGINDFRPENLHRFDLINLQLVLYSLMGNAKVANIGALLLAGFLLALWLLLIFRSRRVPALLVVATLSAINLLPFYHRYYDATLLLLPLCWYVAHFDATSWLDRISLLLWAPFFVPLARPFRLWLATDTSPNPWLDALIRPATNWCLLALSLFLMWRLYGTLTCTEQGRA